MSVPRPRAPGLDVSDSALLGTLLDQAPVGFAFIGPDLRFVRVNRALAGLRGLDPDGHVGRSPAEVGPESLARLAEAALARVLADGRPLLDHGLPGDAQAAPGAPGSVAAAVPGERWSFSWYPSRDPDGGILGVSLIAVDQSHRHTAAESLRRSQERYRSLIQAGAQGVWVTTPAGQTVEEYLALGWLDVIHPDDRERVEQDWQDSLASGKAFDGRYRVRTKSGSYRHHDVRAVPVERDGKIIEWVGASTDVTGQREAEEMRGRLTEQLSAAALRTARLQQATSMLAEALTIEQVVQVITEVGRSAIGAERSAVAMLDPDRLRLKTINPGGLPSHPGALSGEITLDTPSVMTAAINSRRPVTVDSPEAMRRLFEGQGDLTEFLAHTDEQAWGGLPLLSSGAPLGALRFSFTRPRQITDEERVFLEALAGQCALALERASLFEREHTTAETLQRSLLPNRLPIVPGIILEARYLPV